VLLRAACCGFNTFAQFWLAFWSDSKMFGRSVTRTQWWWLDIYCAIQLGSLLTLFLSAVLALITRLKASRFLHEALLEKMLHAPMEFFDTTPIGRLINRFGRDMNAVDQTIPASMQSALRITVTMLATSIGVVVVTPWFFLAMLPMGVVYYFLQKYFISASRELRRLSTLMNSPIFSNFSESISGVDTLRSFGKFSEFSGKNKKMVDLDHQAYYPSVAANRWLAIRLELIGNALIGAAALFCAVTQPSAGLVGVALSTVMSVTQGLNWLVRMKAQLEQDIVSVERIDQYSNDTTPQEKPFEIPSTRPGADWPSSGEISFQNVWMRYRPELDFVLKGLSFDIAGGEKIGVIGRTGAGKSSLFVTLLRLVEVPPVHRDEECRVLIDGVDVARLGLKDLRSRLSVIPQDPVLFTGTIRVNLDPFGERSDSELLDALKLSHCYEAMRRMAVELAIKKERDEQQKKEKDLESAKKKKKGGFFSRSKKQREGEDQKTRLLSEHNGSLNAEEDGDTAKVEEVGHSLNASQFIDDPRFAELNPLDIVVEENGSNFSVGQRQLLCLARAIVRGSKILLLDEATSAVDPQTDQLIQQTIRRVFRNRTILTIAHRIDTILDYDRILIMDSGTVLEYDTPDALLSNAQSRFSEIVQESFGVNLEEVLANKMKFHRDDADGEAEGNGLIAENQADD